MSTKHEKERAALEAAMDRVLAGTTRHAPPGVLTQTALAQEAQLHRSRLVNVHTDLRDLFEARKAAQSSVTDSERALREKVEQLTTANQRLRRERDEWKAAANTFARIVQVLQLDATAAMRGCSITVLKLHQVD